MDGYDQSAPVVIDLFGRKTSCGLGVDVQIKLKWRKNTKKPAVKPFFSCLGPIPQYNSGLDRTRPGRESAKFGKGVTRHRSVALNVRSPGNRRRTRQIPEDRLITGLGSAPQHRNIETCSRRWLALSRVWKERIGVVGGRPDGGQQRWKLKQLRPIVAEAKNVNGQINHIYEAPATDAVRGFVR